MANISGFNITKKKSNQWGKGGRVGGGTEYDQIQPSKDFNIQPEAGLNRHKANVTTDKPYDSHISGK